eukprot:CAMPEP_0179086432 /NCGR_PEP_ID=MMETSP0796-20121207/39207_1 /TAXON_ID=73915 /ORGANISM="Pyrodinium bahamense, Strain pbaha01" /LENGTH=179 /DNA_ID=CAMNT_0020783903 /DNA_START=12 /DNA_END=548 /DNA_ORIENTATION=+
MAPQSPRRRVAIAAPHHLGLCLLALAAACGPRLGFVAPRRRAAAALNTPRAVIALTGDLGRVPEAPLSRRPDLDCDEDCLLLVKECLEEGCPVEAIAQLDGKLASDERKIERAVDVLREKQEEDPVEASWSWAAFDNIHHRLGSLRAQLRAQATLLFEGEVPMLFERGDRASAPDMPHG